MPQFLRAIEAQISQKLWMEYVTQKRVNQSLLIAVQEAGWKRYE